MKLCKSVLLAASVFLVGCVTGYNVGPDITLVPVSYQMSLLIEDSKAAENRLDKFVDAHWNIIANRSAIIYWQTDKGKKLANSYAGKMKLRGLSSDQISVYPSDIPLSAGADLQIITIAYEAITPICKPATVGKYHEDNIIGCYADSLRWKSMISPEKTVVVNE